ncbi:heat stress transcription factor A-6b-like, partial [Trifolium medium]|nr:heat stress transcription factor A-6b-like [Trifolium medium]
MAFLARAMKNPAFIQQLLQHKEKRKEIEEAITKKRRRPIEYGESSNDVKYGFEVSELEVLAMEMQGLGRGKREYEEEIEVFETNEK